MTLNPFNSAAIRPGAREFHFFASYDQQACFDKLLSQLCECKVGSIVGPHGTGKSTLVCSLVKRASRLFERTEVLRMNGVEGSFLHRWKQSDVAHRQAMQLVAGFAKKNALLVIDGAEQFRRAQFRQLMKSCKQQGLHVLVTSHQELPRTQLLYRTSVSAEQVRSLTLSVLDSADEQVRAMVAHQLNAMDLSGVVNLRDFWFDLYDRVQPHLNEVSTDVLIAT